MVARKQRKRKTGIPISPSRAFLQLSNFIPLGLPPKNFHHLPVEPWAGNQAFNTWAFGGHLRSFGVGQYSED
jgi:hypothetical protein